MSTISWITGPGVGAAATFESLACTFYKKIQQIPWKWKLEICNMYGSLFLVVPLRRQGWLPGPFWTHRDVAFRWTTAEVSRDHHLLRSRLQGAPRHLECFLQQNNKIKSHKSGRFNRCQTLSQQLLSLLNLLEEELLPHERVAQVRNLITKIKKVRDWETDYL